MQETLPQGVDGVNVADEFPLPDFITTGVTITCTAVYDINKFYSAFEEIEVFSGGKWLSLNELKTKFIAHL